MNEQFIKPPARVWEKIESILDEQDRLKVKASASNSINRTRSLQYQPAYFQTKSTKNSFVFGVTSLLLLIGFLYRTN